MDNSINILEEFQEACLAIRSKNIANVNSTFSLPSIIDLQNYPFDDKFILFECSCCKEKVEVGFYENGGYSRGNGRSEIIKTGWDYSSENKLNHKDASLLSNILKLSSQKHDKEEYVLTINDNHNPCFILYKRCEKCASEYILVFEPTGDLYREIALHFYIHKLFRVELSDGFKEKYIQK